MEENNMQKPTNLDALRHYLASVIIYGIILLFLIFCPAYYETISNENFDYTGALLIYYVGYIFIAPIIYHPLSNVVFSSIVNRISRTHSLSILICYSFLMYSAWQSLYRKDSTKTQNFKGGVIMAGVLDISTRDIEGVEKLSSLFVDISEESKMMAIVYLSALRDKEIADKGRKELQKA